jgi:hypothetical protein
MHYLEGELYFLYSQLGKVIEGQLSRGSGDTKYFSTDGK